MVPASRAALLIPCLFAMSACLGATAPVCPAPPRAPVADAMVDVGGGLSVHVHCMGSGEPTVILEAGAGTDGSAWQLVQPEIARLTRACVYDRAGAGYSESPARPRDVGQIVRELHTLLANGNLAGPYVLVGHSIGGLYVRLYAVEYPGDVAGMVLVDASSEDQDLRMWSLEPPEVLAAMDDPSDREGVRLDAKRAAMARLRGANRSLGDRPLVVLTAGLQSDEPGVSPELRARESQVWNAMQAELPRLSSNSAHVVAARSHHFIQLEAPELVVAGVREVVDAVRTHGRVDAAKLTALAAPPAPPLATLAPRPTAAPGPIAGVTPVQGDFRRKDFVFTSGETLPELRIHYMTLGTARRDASGHVTNAVLIMHGTTGSGQQFARKQFADVLFGPGQALDLQRYYVILPDDIGHGDSSKPSDGLRARFPHYGYVDMVEAEHALVVDGLGVDHLALVMGTSMGCMHSWLWAETWPSAMDAVMALACLPVPIAGRNREWRRMLIDGIEQDPEWSGGEYTKEPRAALLSAGHLLGLAGSAPMADQKRLPTRDAADKDVEESERRFASTHDANDVLYAVAASRDYDPSADLEKITAPLLLVNSADDFINPPELRIAEREIKRVKHGRFLLIGASESTRGHGTHTWGTFWQKDLRALLAATARK